METLSDKSMVIQTGNPADPWDEEVFNKGDVEGAIKTLRQKLYLVDTESDSFIKDMNKRMDKKLKEVFGDALLGQGDGGAE